LDSTRREHWERIHRDRRPDELGWHEAVPATSLALIERAGVPPDGAIIDVGGGVSRLADHLLDRGYRNLTVLDVSPSALDHARQRRAGRAAPIRWIVADVLEHDLGGAFVLWHDRAVFHFLTERRDRERYRAQLKGHLAPGGHAVIATFAEDGPSRCSGLDVVRYHPAALAEALGGDLALVAHRPVLHRTPAGKDQRFSYCLLRMKE
jgi:SAM-dependent methyltransferase